MEFIEKCKKEKRSLEEIKQALQERRQDDINIELLKAKIKDLNKDVTSVLAQLETEDEGKSLKFKKNINQESLTLIQSLLLLII